MSCKRSLLPEACRNRKRICAARKSDENVPDTTWDANENFDAATLPSDTKAALLYLKNLFPLEKFEGRLPPIITKHQLYSIIRNRTLVDKELEELRVCGEVRLFKLGFKADEFCIVFTQDYTAHVQKFTAGMSVNKVVLDKFLSTVISRCQDVSLNKQTMLYDFNFKDEDITQLVKACVLTVRDVGSWWVAIPGAGLFMKSFLRGRKAILTMIKKCKYKEILQTELEVRKLPKIARLGTTYHIHDIVGAELVECLHTTSGELLRLKD
ncbi:Serine/threonine-protein kinase 19 [Lamellibrachia satsuma]|nr:Serine/threonine-protein kinase 19 [Lamellibrachia satsuma]